MPARTSRDDVADAFVAGEPDALRMVFDLHQRAVHSYCRKFVADQAADVTQEVFLAAWRSRQRFDPATGSLAGWLMGIARFKVIDELRRRYRTDSVMSGDLADAAHLEGRYASDDPEIELMATRILIAEALLRLDEPGCSWIRMAFMEGLAHSEIADRTGVPLGTVKSTIRRGLARMRRDLEAFDADVEPRGGAPSDEGGDAEFQREIDLLHSLAGEPVELVDAPPEVWDAIASAAGIDADAVEAPTARPVEPEPEPKQATVLQHRPRSRGHAVFFAAAATVVVLILGVGLVVANQRSDEVTPVAAAELTPYGGAQVGDAGGTVEVLSEDDQLRLAVDMHDLPAPAPGTYYELWLIDPSSGRPVSVATMKDGSSDVKTDIDLPPGTDTGRYSVVDVSIQEESAGPEHSGDSVLRGTLET